MQHPLGESKLGFDEQSQLATLHLLSENGYVVVGGNLEVDNIHRLQLDCQDVHVISADNGVLSARDNRIQSWSLSRILVFQKEWAILLPCIFHKLILQLGKPHVSSCILVHQYLLIRRLRAILGRARRDIGSTHRC